jgi:hypothetical protein
MRKVLLSLLVIIAGVYLWWNLARPEIGIAVAPWQPTSAPAPAIPLKEREACSDYSENREAFFGDLHIHTALSMDARSREMLSSPFDAYQFASGAKIGFGPFDENGQGLRKGQLRRALDFAAVTDHAEWIGEVSMCTFSGSARYDSKPCRAFRGEVEADDLLGKLLGGSRFTSLMGIGGRPAEVCGEDGSLCRAAIKSAWQLTQEATEQYYDRSTDCEFTAFHGWEYSDSPMMSKVHRNVIFRNELVPEIPISSAEQSSPLELWEKLDKLCNQTGTGCEALTIPHNPNVSNGRMFVVPYRGEELEEQQRQASLRARMEPLVEMMQIKGESECKAGMWQVFGEDELCNFEKMRGMSQKPVEDCEDDYSWGAIRGMGCQSRLDFARYALIEGLVEQDRIGINPYRFGMIGSTDNHNAAPGDVEEDNFRGCCANTDTTVVERLENKAQFAGSGRVARNPGGLVGLYAEENSRDSLFDAMQRREAFGTSGTRIEPRFFAGSDLPEDICQQDFVDSGYTNGVAMGSELPAPMGSSPLFAAAASADPEGTDLQRLQIIKVWHDGAGNFHQQVTDVAGDANNGAHVELRTCGLRGQGERQLCGTWRDPDFSAEQSAAYYVRAVENPSCRWSWHQCLQLPEDQRPASCADPSIPKTIQERAWTSAIWYSASS